MGVCPSLGCPNLQPSDIGGSGLSELTFPLPREGLCVLIQMRFSLIQLGYKSLWAYEEEGESEKKKKNQIPFQQRFSEACLSLPHARRIHFPRRKKIQFKLWTIFIDKAWCPKQDKTGTSPSLWGNRMWDSVYTWISWGLLALALVCTCSFSQTAISKGELSSNMSRRAPPPPVKSFRPIMACSQTSGRCPRRKTWLSLESKKALISFPVMDWIIFPTSTNSHVEVLTSTISEGDLIWNKAIKDVITLIRMRSR